MEINKLQKLNNLLKEFEKDCADGYLDGMSANELMVEVAACAKLEEYKMMVEYMDKELAYHNHGYPSVIDFLNADFTLSFGLRTIQICNNADTFDAIRQILLNEIDAIERG